MNSFHLQIVTPDGLLYDGDAVRLRVRTIDGEVGILAGHADFVSALGMGVCYVDVDDETRRYGACIGGLVAVIDKKTRVVATTFEWADEIDAARAEQAKRTAEQIINSSPNEDEIKTATARLRRAELRLQAYQKAQDI